MTIYGMLLIAYFVFVFVAILNRPFKDWERADVILLGLSLMAFTNFLLYKLGFWTVEPWTWRQIYMFCFYCLGFFGIVTQQEKAEGGQFFALCLVCFHIWIFASSGVFH
jgi:hypothetical protein